MPGGRQGPIRPHRVWTFSKDRLCLSSGIGIVGVPFGLVFTASGTLALLVAFQCLAQLLGLSMLFGQFNPQANNWQLLFMFLFIGSFGAAHFLGGVLLLLTLRTTFDRARRNVVVRSGWLGLIRQQRPMDDFQYVSIELSNSLFFRFVSGSSNDQNYDIRLNGDNCSPLIVGVVTKSHALAMEVANEIGAFIGLPVS